MAINLENTLLAGASTDKGIRVWDIKTTEPVRWLDELKPTEPVREL